MSGEDQNFPYVQTALISSGIFASNIAWSVFVIYIPLFIRRNFLLLYPDSSLVNIVVGLVMILDNVAALLIQPKIGALSDRIWIKKLGRRMPFIIIGIPLAAFFLGLIGTFKDTFFLLIVSITFYNISMAIFKTPVLSLIPDSLPEAYRSEGSGMTSVVGGIGNIVGLFLSAYLYQIKNSLAFWAVGIIMLLCLLVLMFSVREKKDQVEPSKKIQNDPEKVWKFLQKPSNKPLLFVLIAVFFNDCGYQVAETFMSSYTVTYLGFSEHQANYVLGTLAILGILVAFPAALVGKAKGPRDATIFGAILFCCISLPMAFISFFSPDIMRTIFTLNNFNFSWLFFVIFVGVLLIGFSWTIININLVVIIWDMASKSKIATYTGLYYLFASSAAILSPLLAGSFFDLLEFLFPINGLQGLFLFVFFAYTGTIFFLLKSRRLQEIKKEFLSDYGKKQLKQKIKLRKTLLIPLVLFGFGARERPVKQLRKKLKNDRKLFKKNFKEFVKDGDLKRKDYNLARKELRKVQQLEIKAFKEDLKKHQQDIKLQKRYAKELERKKIRAEKNQKNVD